MPNFCQFGHLPNDNVCSLCSLRTKLVSTGFNVFTAVFKQSGNTFWMVADPTETGVLKDYT